MITAVLFAVLLDASAALAQADNRNNANAAAVRAVLDAQAAAWNRGDIDGYMDGYARDETTTFISGDTVTRGWKTVLDRYKQTYDTREKMGTLAFSELNIIGFGDVYIVTGRWQLTRLATRRAAASRSSCGARPRAGVSSTTTHRPRRKLNRGISRRGWIRAPIDHTLAIRYGCINANVCKTCMALVNGKVRYTCTARLDSTPTT